MAGQFTVIFFFFSSRRRHTRLQGDWSSDVCSSDLSVKDTVLEHRGMRLDLVGRTLHFNGQPMDLTNREFALLEIFMQNPGRVLPRTLICEKVWSSPYDVDANLLDVYMSKLRSRLETEGDKPLFKTVRGIGYKLQ